MHETSKDAFPLDGVKGGTHRSLLIQDHDRWRCFLSKYLDAKDLNEPCFLAGFYLI